MPERNVGGLRVAYVLTDYPRLAMTFITGEIDQIEQRGGQVLPISMNSPAASDAAAVDVARRVAATLYLKSGGLIEMVRPVAALASRHPLRLARLIATAVSSSKGNLRTTLRRLVHVSYAARSVERCRERGVHHLHAHFGQSPATIAWFAAEIGNWASEERWSWSMTVHGPHVFVDVEEVRLDLKVASASFVAAISDFTRSQIYRHSDPVHWPKIHVVRCGIELDRFAFRAVPPVNDRPLITTTGRLAPEKGHTVLLDAAVRLSERGGIRPKFQIIGDGPMRSALERRIRELGLEHDVELLGQKSPEEVARQLGESDVFCLPSFAEGLPVAMMEAMAIGTPVVVTHVNGIPELAVDGSTAVTVAPAAPEALADAIAAVLDDPAAARRRADAARAAVEARHDRIPNVDALIELLSEAIDDLHR